MATAIQVTIPDYLEAVFIAPDSTRIGVYRSGDYVNSDWKCLQIRMRREITHPNMRVPWGELIVATAGCALVYRHFHLHGLLIAGITTWIAQRIVENTKNEIDTRKRAATSYASSEPSSYDGPAPSVGR